MVFHSRGVFGFLVYFLYIYIYLSYTYIKTLPAESCKFYLVNTIIYGFRLCPLESRAYKDIRTFPRKPLILKQINLLTASVQSRILFEARGTVFRQSPDSRRLNLRISPKFTQVFIKFMPRISKIRFNLPFLKKSIRKLYEKDKNSNQTI